MGSLSHRTKLILSLLGPLLLLGGLELGLRLAQFRNDPVKLPVVVFNRAQDQAMREGGDRHQLDPSCLWSPRPGAAAGDGSEFINPLGYRGPALSEEPSPGVLRVALMGESNVYGYGMPFPSTVGHRLNRALQEQGLPNVVLNAGVLGHTAWQGLGRYRTVVAPARPHVVVLMYGAVNEHLAAQDAPDQQKLALLAATPGVVDGVLAWLRQTSRVVHLLSWLAQGGQSSLEWARQQRDEQQAARQTSLDLSGRVEWTGPRRVSLDEFSQCLRQLAQEAQADGARVLLVSLPRVSTWESQRPVLAEYSARIAALSQSLGLPCVDLRARFQRGLLAGDDVLAWFQHENSLHLSALGQDVLAAELVPLVMAVEPSPAELR